MVISKVLKMEDQKRKSSCRALLDGGATCILRLAVSEEEYASGWFVRVEGHGKNDPEKGQQSNVNY